MYIVLEGPDGSGTTSHTTYLCEYLRDLGNEIVRTNEPTDGPIGKCIRTALAEGNLSNDALQLMFCADRAHHMQEIVEPALRENKIVVSDRNYYSTLAYGQALGLDRGWLTQVNSAFRTPDITIFLLPPVDVLASRMSERKARDIMENDSFQRHVYDAYVQIAAENPSIKVVDTSGSREESAEMIRSCISQ